MKLSDKTTNILKNFASINQSILFKEGNQIKTISVMKNILAEAVVDETFSKDFGIYDLTQFLNGISLYEDPELDFSNEDYLTIKEGKMRSKYFFADPNVIITPPDKEISIPSEDVAFELSTQQLGSILKASSIYQLPDLCVVGEAGVVKLVVTDKKNNTSNDVSLIVGETENNFSFNFKIENIKIIPGTYQVTICKKLISMFYSKNYNLKYYIALEPDSTFSE